MNNLVDQALIDAEIINIYWERINLYIDVEIHAGKDFDKHIPVDFYALNGKRFAKAKFETERISDNVYRLSLNITNPGYNRCLPRGTYTIAVCQGDNEIAHCMTSPLIVDKMNDYSRAFPYANQSKVYNVVFYVGTTNDYSLPFHMYVMASAAEKNIYANTLSYPVAERAVSKGSLLHRVIRRIKKPFGKDFRRYLIKKLYKLFYNIHSHKKPVVLFMSEQNKSISSNQNAVYKRMIERGLDRQFKCIFSFRSSVAERQGILSWLQFINKLSKSTMIILDDHVPAFDWLVLKKETTIIQLWHAGAGFKSSGYSRWGNTGCPSPYSCHRQYKYGIAGSEKIAHFFSEVWGINKEQVLPTGMPRIDEFLDEEYRKEKTEMLYKSFPVCKNKKVILFAPTYRGKNKKNAYYPYNIIDFDKLYEACGNEYVILFKVHPWISEPVPLQKKHADKFIDVAEYSNINDLFYITDLLITDYSSSIFEYSLMNKPMLFFAYDEIQYSFSRGFHRDYKHSAPGKIVYTFDELIHAINEKDFEFEKVKQYVEFHFDYVDSNSSDRVIDWLILGNMPEYLQKRINDKNAEVKRTANLAFEQQ